uniref:Uncharacterized protein n=1 Tax=Oryza rufipogon TaxID=4529 RepID=A0A0E0Q9G8_ORYRU
MAPLCRSIPRDPTPPTRRRPLFIFTSMQPAPAERHRDRLEQASQVWASTAQIDDRHQFPDHCRLRSGEEDLEAKLLSLYDNNC